MAINCDFMFSRADNKQFVAIVTEPIALWVLGPRQAPPTSGLALGRMLDSMKNHDILNFVFEGWQTTAVHRLLSAHTSGTDLKATMYAVQDIIKAEKTVKCHTGFFPGTDIPHVECEVLDLAKKATSLITTLILDVRIRQFLPVAGVDRGAYLVQLAVEGWIERVAQD